MSTLLDICTGIGLVVVITVGWYGFGFFFNSLVAYPLAARAMPWKRVIIDKVPWWYEPIKYLSCGPTGWAMWVLDKRDAKRSREAMERMRQRRAEERERGW